MYHFQEAKKKTLHVNSNILCPRIIIKNQKYGENYNCYSPGEYYNAFIFVPPMDILSFLIWKTDWSKMILFYHQSKSNCRNLFLTETFSKLEKPMYCYTKIVYPKSGFVWIFVMVVKFFIENIGNSTGSTTVEPIIFNIESLIKTSHKTENVRSIALLSVR